MFGESLMFGTFERTLDKKGRILLPSICCTNDSDILVLLAKENFVEIWNKEDFMYLVQKLKKDDNIYLDEITAFVSNMTGVTNTRNSYRVNLGIHLVTMYQFQEGVVIEGKGKCIRIWNKSNFFKYKNNLNSIDLLNLQKKSKKIKSKNLQQDFPKI